MSLADKSEWDRAQFFLSHAQKYFKKFVSWADCKRDVLSQVNALGLGWTLEGLIDGKVMTVLGRPLDGYSTEKVDPEKLLRMSEEEVRRQILNTLVTEDDAKALRENPGDEKTKKNIRDKRQARKIMYDALAFTVQKFYTALEGQVRDPMILWAKIRYAKEGTRTKRMIKAYRDLYQYNAKDFSTPKEVAAHCEKALMAYRSLGEITQAEALRAGLLSVYMGSEQYQNVIDKACMDPSMTMDQIKLEILGVDERRQGDNKMRRLKPRPSHPPKDRPCYHCSKLGHGWRNCPTRPAGKQYWPNGKVKKPKARRVQQPPQTDASLPWNPFTVARIRLRRARTHGAGATFIIDTGAEKHVFGDNRYFVDYTPRRTVFREVVSDHQAVAVGVGTVVIPLGGGKQLRLTGVYHVPETDENLISARRLADDKYYLTIVNKTELGIKRRNVCLVVTNKEDQATYTFHAGPPAPNDVARRISNRNQSRLNKSVLKWHYALGHPPISEIKKIQAVVKGLTIGEYKKVIGDCRACEAHNAHRRAPAAPKPSNPTPMANLSVDLVGRVLHDVDGKNHCMIITDEASQFLWAEPIFGMQFFHEYKKIIRDFELETKKKVRQVTTDAGSVFTSALFKEWNRNHGIQVNPGAPRQPKHNGRCERAIQTLWRKMKIALTQSTLDKEYWPYALKHTAYTWNRTHPVDKGDHFETPFQLIFGVRPDVSHLHPFGCVGYRFVPSDEQKFGPRGEPVRFLGYTQRPDTFTILREATHGHSRRRIQKESHVVWYDTDFTFQDLQVAPEHLETPSQSRQPPVPSARPVPSIDNLPHVSDTSDSEPPVSDDDGLVSPTQTPVAPAADRPVSRGPMPRYPTRNRSRVMQYNPHSGEFERPVARIQASGGSGGDNVPKSYFQAMATPSEWQGAINSELRDLDRNRTWKIVERKPNMQVIKSLWTFAQKKDKNGKVIKHKGRLVADGRTRHGVSYAERYAPTLAFSSVRAIFALAVYRDMKIDSGDVNNAFLHARLDDTVYMEIPMGMQSEFNRKKYVCQLEKGLYGLPEAAKLWADTIKHLMLKNDYKQSTYDPCLYYKGSVSNHTLELVGIYVDDIVVVSDKTSTILDVMHQRFGIKNRGFPEQFLGVNIDRINKDIVMCQRIYIQTLINRYGLTKVKGLKQPIPASFHAKNFKGDSTACNGTDYRELVGCLNFISTRTRPDIKQAVSRLSRYSNKPTIFHYERAIDVLRYLKWTKNEGIRFKPSRYAKFSEMYTDADHAGELSSDDNPYSRSGWVITIGGIPIIWGSQKQSIVAKSTCAAEYIAVSRGMEDLVWIRNMLVEIGFHMPVSPIYCDNESCIAVIETEKVKTGVKSLQLSYHSFKDYVKKGDVKPTYVRSGDNFADLFTKFCQAETYQKFRDRYFGKVRLKVE